MLKKEKTRGRVAIIISVAIVLTDQAIKIWVKTNMSLHESIEVTKWFYIVFIENNGMAYGLQLGSKLLLSIFRIVAIAALGYYLWLQTKKKVRTGFVASLAMIFAGAIGNLIDCMFYGLVFSSSTPYNLASWVPFGEGYSAFLMGKVVDMFHFPLIVTTYPDWFPFFAGEDFVFFSPIFNFADAAISVGVFILILFYRDEISDITLKLEKETERKTDATE